MNKFLLLKKFFLNNPNSKLISLPSPLLPVPFLPPFPFSFSQTCSSHTTLSLLLPLFPSVSYSPGYPLTPSAAKDALELLVFLLPLIPQTPEDYRHTPPHLLLHPPHPISLSPRILWEDIMFLKQKP